MIWSHTVVLPLAVPPATPMMKGARRPSPSSSESGACAPRRGVPWRMIGLSEGAIAPLPALAPPQQAPAPAPRGARGEPARREAGGDQSETPPVPLRREWPG